MTFSLHISYKNFLCLPYLLYACYIPNPYHSVPQWVKWLDYVLKDTGFKSRQGQQAFSRQKRSNRLWGSPSFLRQWLQGVLISNVKRPGREADNSCPLRTSRAMCTPRMCLRPVRWRVYITSTWRWAHSRKCKPFAFIHHLTSNHTKYKTSNVGRTWH